MGAQQSTADVGGGEVKTSYYELLGVERTATEDEIKKAYRRKALELHPDRNYGDIERATALFADVQSAYEVLSDPQERAWYDAHEGDILRGGEKGADEHYEYNMKVTTAEDISRMMGKFRGNVDFSDSPSGFFGFVRETFEQLAHEEERAGDYEGVRVPDYPSFGHKKDTHDDVVRNFYASWNDFATVKSFASLDVYRTSDAPDRRVRRLMEKENRKYRDEGIRKFNDAVRTLVAFVRKRDPRYTPDTQTAEEKAKALREARNQQAARSRAAHAAKIKEDQTDAVPDWAKVRDPDELEEESEEEVEEEHFECVACRKTFKSERQWEAHERSKKHQKALHELRKKMRKDDTFLHLDDQPTSSGIATPAPGDEQPLDHATRADKQDDSLDELGEKLENVHVEIDNASTDDETLETHSTDSDPERSTDYKPHAPTEATSTGSDSGADDNEEYASRADVEARLAGYRKKDASAPPDGQLPVDPPDTDNAAAPAGKKLGAAAKKRAKRAAKQADVDVSDSSYKCATCEGRFASKTQLFKHLKNDGHAAPVSVTGSAGKKGKRK